MTTFDIKNTFAINEAIEKEFENIRVKSQYTKLINRVKTNLRNGEVKIHYIHNPYLAKLFEIAGGVEYDKVFEISVQPIDQNITPDQQYKTSALKSLWHYFINGIEKGEDYFKTEFEATYKQLYINNPERLFDMLNTDYTEGVFGYKHANETQKTTIKEYKENYHPVFNELTIFNYGFINGVCDSFLNFITTKPTLQKVIKQTSISVRANSDPATKKAVYKNLAEVWFFGFKHGNENKILNLENWETYKNEFYSFKISSYEDKYTLDEKKELERLKLAEIEAKDPDFDILKKRYLTYLNEIDDYKKPEVKKVTNFEDFFKKTTPKQIELLKDFSTGFNSKQSAIFIDLLYNDFNVLEVIPGNKKGKSPKDFAKLFNTETYSGLNDFFDKSKAYNGVKLVYKDQKQSEYLQMKAQLKTILNDLDY